MPVINIISPKMALLLILLMPLITYAKTENQVDKFAEAKAEPEGDVPVIKLEDIIAGKHSGKKSKNIEKADINQSTDSPVAKKKQEEEYSSNTETIKPVEKTQSVDLKEAYSVLMNPNNTPKKASNKVIAPPVAVANKSKVASTKGRSTGWLYLGKFSKGQWDNKNNQTLGLNAVLPNKGHYYSLQVHSNIRNNYPSKRGMPPVRQVLSKGSKVRILDIHNSGRSGHYWAKVEW